MVGERMKGWDENRLGTPWNGIQNERPLFSVLWYLKGSIQALDPQSVHVGVGNVIDQLHLDSVISSERSSTRDPAQGTCLLWALVLYIRITVKCVNEGGNEANGYAFRMLRRIVYVETSMVEISYTNVQ